MFFLKIILQKDSLGWLVGGDGDDGGQIQFLKGTGKNKHFPRLKYREREYECLSCKIKKRKEIAFYDRDVGTN
jgi:hypothetical protein